MQCYFKVLFEVPVAYQHCYGMA